MRAWGIEVAIVAAILAAAPSAHAQQYTIVDLGTLGGTNSIGYAVNNKGQVAGDSYLSNGRTRAFLYANGIMTNLGTLGGEYSGASHYTSKYVFMGVNDNGQVSGTSLTSSGHEHAFLYQNGTMIDLGTLGGPDSNGNAINENGQVTGWADRPDGIHAFLYSDGVMKDLGTLGGYASVGYGISDDGKVVGSSIAADGAHYHAFLYANGVMTDLGTLPGSSGSEAYGISPNGRLVTGSSYFVTGNHAFLYANGVMADLGPGLAYGVNDHGDVVGLGLGPFLYTNGTMVLLEDLLPADSGWTLGEAFAINNLGQITGWGINKDGAKHAFLMSPPAVDSWTLNWPEPDSQWTLDGNTFILAAADGDYRWGLVRGAPPARALVAGPVSLQVGGDAPKTIGFGFAVIVQGHLNGVILQAGIPPIQVISGSASALATRPVESLDGPERDGPSVPIEKTPSRPLAGRKH